MSLFPSCPSVRFWLFVLFLVTFPFADSAYLLLSPVPLVRSQVSLSETELFISRD